MPLPSSSLTASTLPAHPSIASLTLLALLLASAFDTNPVQAQSTNLPRTVVAGVQSYQIEAGPLDRVLNQFGTQGRILIVIDPALTAGRHSAGLAGQHTLDDGFAHLLAGTDLEAMPEQNGNAFRLRRRPATQGVSTLAPVTVSGIQDSATEATGSYASYQVGMAKGQTLREIPHAVTVVTRQRIEDQNLSTLTEVLDQTTGLTLQRAGPSAGSSLGQDSNFYSRGFAVGNIQIDGGAPMETVMNGFGSISQIDMAQYDHVEFLRGVDGLFSSTGDPGGTINLVRKAPQADTRFTFSSTAGSWDNYRTEADATGALNTMGTIRGRAGAAWQDRRYFYETARMRSRLVYGSLQFDLTPATELTLGGSYQDASGIPDFAGLPRYSNGADLDLPRRTALIPDWAYTDDSTRELYARLEHHFNDRWSLQANALHSRMRRDHGGAYVFGGVDPQTLQGSYLYTFPEFNEMNRVAMDLNLRGQVDAFGRTHTLMLGADFQRGKADSWQNTGYLGYPINVFDPTFPEQDDGPFPLKDSYYTTKKSAIYGMLRLGLSDTVHLIAGGRLSNYSYKNNSIETNGSGYTPGLRHLKESNVFTPYAGLTYDIQDDWTLYASYAETFRPQYMQRKGPQPGTPLDPVKARNYELGLKGNLLEGRAIATFAIYRIEQTGAAAEDPRYPLSYGAFNCCFINQGKVVSQGFEAELAGEILPGWQISAGYTYNHNTDKEADQSYSSITPKHMLKLWSTYRLPERLNDWSIGAGVTAQSATFVRGTARAYNPATQKWDGDNVPFNFSQAGYALWNARIDYRINEMWRAALNVNNLFDKRYYSSVGSSVNSNFYGEPRNFMLSLRGQF